MHSATRTQTVMLHSIEPAHATALVTCAAELARGTAPPWWATPGYTEEDALRYIHRAGAKRQAVRGEVFLVCSGHAPQGCCALDEVDWVHGHASIWMWLTPGAGQASWRGALAELRNVAKRRGLTSLQALIPESNDEWRTAIAAAGGELLCRLPGRYLLDGLRVDGVLLTLRA